MRGLKKISLVLILMFSTILVGCGEKSGISTDSIKLSVDKEVSTDGNYVIKVEILKDIKNVSYVLNENGKVVDSKENISGPFEKESNIRNNNLGEHIYDLEVKSEDGDVVKKSLTVKVQEEQIEDDEDNTDKPSLNGVDSWNANSKEYVQGDKVSFNEEIYECVQPHTSQDAWTPKDTPALWKINK